MFVFLIIVLIYLLVVCFAFLAVWFGDYEYRKKCKTLHEFLFEENRANNYDNGRAFAILFPIINIFVILIYSIKGCIKHFSDWAKNVKLNQNIKDQYNASLDKMKEK